MYRIVLILLITATTFSCEKPDVRKPNENPIDTSATDSNALEVVWQKKLGNDAISIQPQYYNGQVLFSSDEANPTSIALWALNSSSGELNWEWANFLTNIGLSNGKNKIYRSNDNLIYGGGTETGLIGLANGNTIWQNDQRYSPRLWVIGDFIYREQEVGQALRVPTVHLVRTPLHQASWDTVFTLHVDSLGYTPSIEGPSLWMSPKGDSVLVFQNRSYNFDLPDGRIDFYAYNLSQKQVQFVLRDIEPDGNSNVVPPVIDGNRCYFMGARQFYCIDLVQQEIVWTKQYLGRMHHIMLSNCIVDGNRVFVKTDNDALYCYDKMNGDVIWQITEGAGHTSTYMVLHDGILYYTADGNGKLFAVNAQNGDIIWAEDSPNEENYPAGFNGGVAIDPERGYIFAADWYYAMAIKLPEK